MSSPFIKVDSKYCPNCNNETLSVLTDGNKSNPTIISYMCKNCRNTLMINWSNYKNPRPLYIDYKVLMNGMQNIK